MAIEKFTAELVKSELVSPQVKRLIFKRTDGHPLRFVAGQFVTFLFSVNGEIKRRSYSLANFPEDSETFEIIISYVPNGIASETLFAFVPGQTVDAMGPAGKLVLQVEPVKRYILVGTGTGVAPYRAMLPELKVRQSKENIAVVLLQGVRHRSDGLYINDFRSFVQAVPHSKFKIYYSREASENLAHDEGIGYVQQAFNELSIDPTSDIIYLCGNPNMIDEAFNNLLGLGVASQNIRREKYISSN